MTMNLAACFSPGETTVGLCSGGRSGLRLSFLYSQSIQVVEGGL